MTLQVVEGTAAESEVSMVGPLVQKYPFDVLELEFHAVEIVVRVYVDLESFLLHADA